MSHESFGRDDDVRASSNRSFGVVFAVVFTIVGLLPLLSGGAVRVWALVVAAAFAVFALAFPAALAPLNRIWLKFGLLLHRVVNPIMLGIMFYGVITPTGLIMRAFGKDPLRLRFEKDADTYWIVRTPPGPAPDSLRDQF
jgi:hypothetical protein